MDRLYSRHGVRESLRAGRRSFQRLLIAEGVDDAPILRDIRTLAGKHRVSVHVGRRDAMNNVTPQHQGVLLEAGDYPYVDIDDILAHAAAKGEAPFVLVLDALQDPQNFGTLIRAAEATGVHGVVIAERRSVSVTPAVVNASSGAVEHMRVAQVVNLTRAIEQLKKADVWVWALDGGPDAKSLFTSDLRGPLALVVGSEGDGVHRLVRETSDFVVALPMRGQIESLNAATAGAVALYEALRQRSV
jgi:23S rRNA (guanosine2251-2'-O)-methyltransferase